MGILQRQKPIPRPNELTQPFWDAAREERLVIQRCEDCGYYNHPPKPLCDDCSSRKLSFCQVAGTGTINSFTVMHEIQPGFESETPYLNVLVELDEQKNLFMITNLLGTERNEVSIGQRVEVAFERVNDDITLPQFKPTKQAE